MLSVKYRINHLLMGFSNLGGAVHRFPFEKPSEINSLIQAIIITFNVDCKLKTT